jgi:hypothetical protein
MYPCRVVNKIAVAVLLSVVMCFEVWFAVPFKMFCSMNRMDLIMFIY